MFNKQNVRDTKWFQYFQFISQLFVRIGPPMSIYLQCVFNCCCYFASFFRIFVKRTHAHGWRLFSEFHKSFSLTLSTLKSVSIVQAFPVRKNHLYSGEVNVTNKWTVNRWYNHSISSLQQKIIIRKNVFRGWKKKF